MNKIKVLDCTLRDGGYCNDWRFGDDNIYRIADGLIESGIDIIECGFVTDRIEADIDISKFTSVESASKALPYDRGNSIYVVMINYGEYDAEKLPDYKNGYIDGIRIAFHKKDVEAAFKFAETVKKKRYKVFLQPMVSPSYSDEEFLDLIRRSSELHPFAFYIVDSFGVMKRRDLIRMFYMVEHDLDSDIAIGFHSHNNMQLAYSNAQALVDVRTKHNLIIDSSIYGMGRGAGNLNTELFVEYLNDTVDSEYKLKPLLTIIDEILDKFYQKNYWGYSLPNYLSASHNAHPNYAGYLNDKHTLTVEQMNDIFDLMEDDKRVNYDKMYIEKLYQRYLSIGKVQEERKVELSSIIKDKMILLIAPGKSSFEEKEKIIEFASRSNIVSVSINHDYPYYDSQFIFLSNLRRYKELDITKRGKCIVTSNIPADSVFLKTEYKALLNSYEMAQDNAGMMAIKFFISNGVKEIYLAGLDGYSHDISNNFGDDKMAFITKSAVFDAMNAGISDAVSEFARIIKINFLTKPRFIRIK